LTLVGHNIESPTKQLVLVKEMVNVLITKECDYGIRIIRALADGEKRTVKTICEMELVPFKFAYKILKKLQKAGIVQNKLGQNGGYVRIMPLDEFTLYDIIQAIDERLFLAECLRGDIECQRKVEDEYCKVHDELVRLQSLLIDEMKSRSIAAIME